jgi:hypothetical protein
MQAVGLVTGDEFLVPYNLTIDTEDTLEFMKKLLFPWKLKHFIRHATFDEIFGIDFALIIASSGFCYNFNLINPEELFNLKM